MYASIVPVVYCLLGLCHGLAEEGGDGNVASAGGSVEGRVGPSRKGGVGADVEEELHDGLVAVGGSVGEGGASPWVVNGVDAGLDRRQLEKEGHGVGAAVGAGPNQGRLVPFVEGDRIRARRHQLLHHHKQAVARGPVQSRPAPVIRDLQVVPPLVLQEPERSDGLLAVDCPHQGRHHLETALLLPQQCRICPDALLHGLQAAASENVEEKLGHGCEEKGGVR